MTLYFEKISEGFILHYNNKKIAIKNKEDAQQKIAEIINNEVSIMLTECEVSFDVELRICPLLYNAVNRR